MKTQIRNFIRITTREHLNESLDSTRVFSGKDVNDHIRSITPNENDLPFWFMDNLIKSRKFKIEQINLNDLLNTDPDFKEHYNNGDVENRYEDEDIDPENINQELVIVDGELLDGYNRASSLLNSGIDSAYAYIALPKSELKK